MKAQYRCHGTYYGNDAVQVRCERARPALAPWWTRSRPRDRTGWSARRTVASASHVFVGTGHIARIEPGSWPVIRGRYRGWRARAPCTSSILRDQRRPSRPPRRARRRHGIIGRSALVRVGSKERGEERDEQEGEGGDPGDRRVLHDPLLLAVDLHGRLDRLRAGGPGQNMAVREVG